MELDPSFSIVIPTYNRPERLKQCLQSLARLDYPRDRFEVVVVDDGSRMSLAPVTQPFETQLPLRLIRQDNAGPANARNTGAAAAKGHYLVFTDDDCQPTVNWLTALAEALHGFPNALIGGHTINALPDNLYSTTSQLLIDYIYTYYNQTKGEPTFFASNNFAVPRIQYQELGGFDTSFPLAAGEDREFCDRWLHHGLPMHYAPDMRIYHSHTLTLKSFWRQHFNYGRGAFCFHQVRAKRNAQPIQVEPFSFYINLLTYPLKQPSSQPGLLVSGLMFLSQIANVVGFAQGKGEHRRQAELVKP
ncbi:MAG: glycosyltransferase family 2 protein [Leptolyngbyaceae cyanobacterium]